MVSMRIWRVLPWASVALWCLVCWPARGVEAVAPSPASDAPAPLPAAAAIARLEILPPEVELSTSGDRQRLVVLATRTDGVTLDVTSQAELSLGDGSRARLEQGVLSPLADGDTTLRASWSGQAAEVAVSVRDATTERPVSFQLDVMPIFMRAGCNTGSCHGAARGKDGFMLSLFGYDPAGDQQRITREVGFRRLQLGAPRSSMLLEKIDGSVPHTGGKRLEPESEHWRTLLRWLEAGAAYDAIEPPKVTALEIFPRQVVLEGSGTKQQFIARAKYSDGTDRDVTPLAVFLTNNDNSAAIDADGLVTAGARGEAFVMARYETHTVGSQALALPAGLEYRRPETPPANYVDELVNAKLDKLRLEPSEICSDEVFLRRATIDITGLLPTEAEHAEFTSDPAPDKRSRLIDRLLERKEFSEIWAMKWAELLMIRTTVDVSNKSAFLYANWLTQQIANNVPLDAMVRGLLGASGGTFSNPATNYYQIERDTLKTAENVAQVFMGIRTQCAQCHNHPFDRWTMNDYYGFAAFFAQIGRKEGEDYRETIIFNTGGGEVAHPVGGRVMAPKFLGGATPETTGKDRRTLLAEWLTSAENPFFATSVANRVWQHFFGVGIVEPIDDIRVSNPASNPELFAALGAKFTGYGYDFKQLVRDICNSQAYQRSTQRNASNEQDELNFAHARIRRIRAENLLDCISQATDTRDKFSGLPVGARAVQIADGQTSNYFLSTFGRSTRASVCTCEVKTEPTLSQALHMINGDTVDTKVRTGGLIPRLLAEGQAPDAILERLYVRTVGRKPSEEERLGLQSALAGEPTPQVALEDMFWTLLNSREFLFNH